jgi:hypothetical protein
LQKTLQDEISGTIISGQVEVRYRDRYNRCNTVSD